MTEEPDRASRVRRHIDFGPIPPPRGWLVTAPALMVCALIGVLFVAQWQRLAPLDAPRRPRAEESRPAQPAPQPRRTEPEAHPARAVSPSGTRAEHPPTAPAPDTPAAAALPPRPAVVNFSLLDAVTGAPIAGHDPLFDGAMLNLAALPTRRLNIRVSTQPAQVGAVRFDLDGQPNVRSATNAPYTLLPQGSSGTRAWTPSPGWHVLSAVPSSPPETAGPFKGCTLAGEPATLRFRVVDQPEGPAEPVPIEQAPEQAPGKPGDTKRTERPRTLEEIFFGD